MAGIRVPWKSAKAGPSDEGRRVSASFAALREIDFGSIFGRAGITHALHRKGNGGSVDIQPGNDF
jgi:hypothetical protein